MSLVSSGLKTSLADKLIGLGNHRVKYPFVESATSRSFVM